MNEAVEGFVNLIADNAVESNAAAEVQNPMVTDTPIVTDDFSVVPDNLAEVGSGDWEILCPGYAQNSVLPEDASFYSKDDVALYIHTYGKLPKNFIKKSEWEKLGTDSNPYNQSDGLVIGGDRFYNREGLLPKKSGRSYTECDIDTLNKKSRGAKRIVFSNDGLIYYTADHYESFELLYGEE
ncbi:MAG: hypothetical protein IKP60_08990 [Treponema sp.]|nr:hypothetical protein [Treponema sp.]